MNQSTHLGRLSNTNQGRACALDTVLACFAQAKNHRLCSYKLALLRPFRGSSFLNHEFSRSLQQSLRSQNSALLHTYSPPAGLPRLHPPHPQIHLHSIALVASQLPYNRQLARQKVPLMSESAPLLY